MRLLIATDAWRPQINGVVRSLEYMAAEAPRFGAEVVFLTPERFRSIPMPTYPEIRLSLVRPGALSGILEEIRPTHVHIATEGPIGLATRLACLRQGQAFTTSYHTRFPEYVAARTRIPEAWSYRALKRFHRAARAMMVSTRSLERELTGRGFRNIMRWTRGVDTALFRPRNERILDAAAPVFLYVGRVAVEKNLEAFLSLDLPGTKVVVGDGPPVRTSNGDIRRPDSSGRSPGRIWPGSMPPRTSSSFRASPTPSASSSSRRWPPACRSQPFRLPGRWTCSAPPAAAFSYRIYARRPSRRSTFPRIAAGPMAKRSPGRKAPGNSSPISRKPIPSDSLSYIRKAGCGWRCWAFSPSKGPDSNETSVRSISTRVRSIMPWISVSRA